MIDDFHGTLRRVMPNGRQVVLAPLTFQRGRLCVGPVDALEYDTGY